MSSFRSLTFQVLIIFGLALLAAAAAGLILSAQTAEASPLRQGDPPQEGDHAGERCFECHADYTVQWETGAHAQAYHGESFQADWAARGSPAQCLDCHTTRFQPSTGQFLDEDVTCESCHGVNPANHPPAPFPVLAEAEMCGECHQGTFQEWRSSPHAVTDQPEQIVCATCHEPHTQLLRYESIDELCLSCHIEPPPDFAHTSHLGQQELHCGDCHMYRDPDQGPEIGNLLPTGHTMDVDTLACNDCHQDLNRRLETFDALSDPERLVLEQENLQNRVAELRQQLEETPAAETPAPQFNVIQLTQGLIVGVGMGAALAWVLSRRDSSGNDTAKNNKTNGNEKHEDNS